MFLFFSIFLWCANSLQVRGLGVDWTAWDSPAASRTGIGSVARKKNSDNGPKSTLPYLQWMDMDYFINYNIIILYVYYVLYCWWYFYLWYDKSCSELTGLQSLTLGDYNLRLPSGILPDGLQYLRFGSMFNSSLEYAELPESLQTLIFGRSFNESLEKVKLPSLRTLVFGDGFNQSLEKVEFPSLENLTLPAGYNHSLDCVNFPATLRSLECRGIMVSSVWAKIRAALGVELVSG